MNDSPDREIDADRELHDLIDMGILRPSVEVGCDFGSSTG